MGNIPALRALRCAALVLGLAACQPDDSTAEPPGPVVADQRQPQNEEACLAAGGEWGRMGMRNVHQCALPTPDSGKACDQHADCTTWCEASEAGNSGACGAVTPRFGCFDLWENAQLSTICID